MSTSIAEYSPTEAALSNLAAKYQGVVFDVTTPLGMRDAKQSRTELRGYRIALEKLRVEIKAPALKRTQEIDSEARRITAALSALEDPIDGQIKQEEQRKENERLAAERAAQEKVEAEYQALREEEGRKLAAERAEIERQRAELAEQQRAMKAKLEAEERAARLKIEEAERAARMEREEAERTARAKREAEEAEARKLRQKEEDQIRAERQAVEAERQKVEAEARAKRQAEEAAERQRLGAIQELMDGKALLTTFLIRFAHRKEFAEICGPISSFLDQPYK